MANQQSIDIKLTPDDTGLYDISIKDGDLESVDGLQTAIAVSLFTDGRAPSYNVPDSVRRRGWICNVGRQQKLPTSLLWLLSQSRITQATLNAAKLYVEECLQWMIDNKIAKTIDVELTPEERGIVVAVTIIGYNDQSNKYYALWKATGNANGR